MKSITAIAVALTMALTSACGTGTIAWDDQELASYPVTLLDQAPEDVVNRAEEFLAGVRGSDMAPEWTTEARLDYEVRLLQRPDVEGVAYYEFGVDQGGFIMMSSGEHDFAFPHWSTEGGRPTDRLLSEAGEETVIGGFYKLDAVTYVAEDASGNIVSLLGKLPPRLPEELGSHDRIYSTEVSIREVDGQPVEEINHYVEIETDQGTVREPDLENKSTLAQHSFQSWSTWQALKAGYADHYRARLDGLAREVVESELEAGHDAEMRTTRGAPHGNQSINMTYAYWVNLVSDLKNLRYSQFTIGGCLSGCGATAWTILMAHLSKLGQAGYSPCGERAFSGPVPNYNNLAVETTTRSIANALGTLCWGDSGFTWPWSMDNVSIYLNHCYFYYTLRTDYSLSGSRASLRDHVIQTVKYKKRPSVIGTGFYDHYAVVAGYGITWRGDRYFWVNNGWTGSHNGWIPASTWFYGDVSTRGCIQIQPHDDDGCGYQERCCLPGPNDTCRQCIPDSHQCL